jgi:hypothetical protein
MIVKMFSWLERSRRFLAHDAARPAVISSIFLSNSGGGGGGDITAAFFGFGFGFGFG